MTLIIEAKIKTLKILGCPEGCRKKFGSTMALNNHLTKTHNSKYKIDLDSKGRAYARRTLRLAVT